MKKYLYIILLLLAVPVHAEWTQQNSGTTADLVDVCFVDELHGWAIGNKESLEPVIIATIDGGVTWHQQECPDEVSQLNRVFFITENIGFIACESSGGGDDYKSYIFSTINGGDMWEISYIAPYYYHFQDVYFIDKNTGWIAGGVHGLSWDEEPYGGVVLLTKDGGETWEEQLHVTLGVYARYDSFESIVFSNDSVGWILGNDRRSFSTPATNVYRTIDGGKNWGIVSQLVDTYPGFSQTLQAISSDTLWSSASGTYRSFDGGVTWSQSSSSHDISFITGTAGWALFADGVYYTDNAGDTWESQEPGLYRRIDNVGGTFACAVGFSGDIATYHDTPTHVKTPTQPDIFTLEPNYPNPFNASTTIPYTLAIDSPVTIKLYSATGQIVRILCDSHMSEGRHSTVVDGSDLSSGVYIARVQAQGSTKYTRMLLLK